MEAGAGSSRTRLFVEILAKVEIGVFLAAPALTGNERTDIAYVAPVGDVQSLAVSMYEHGVRVGPAHREMGGVFRLAQKLDIGIVQPLVTQHLPGVLIRFERNRSGTCLDHGILIGGLDEFTAQRSGRVREAGRGQCKHSQESDHRYLYCICCSTTRLPEDPEKKGQPKPPPISPLQM